MATKIIPFIYINLVEAEILVEDQDISNERR